MTGETSSPIYTIGHSTRSIVEFVELLRVGDVQLVVDIRTVPRSRTNPQYNQDSLPAALERYQIGYVRIPELGGLRKKVAGVAPETNGFWTNQSFHNYADYALSDEFKTGLSQLLRLADERRCAIMCSEAVWWRCHRRIVADYLLNDGRTVFHLMDGAKLVPATMTVGAQPNGEELSYPADASAVTKE